MAATPINPNAADGPAVLMPNSAASLRPGSPPHSARCPCRFFHAIPPSGSHGAVSAQKIKGAVGGTHTISIGCELTVGVGIAVNLIAAFDKDGNVGIFLAPSGRVGLNAGVSGQASYSDTYISDMIDDAFSTNTCTHDISIGYGFGSGDIAWDSDGVNNYGVAIGQGIEGLGFGPGEKLGASFGVLDPDPIPIWTNVGTVGTEPIAPATPVQTTPETNDNPVDDGPPAPY